MAGTPATTLRAGTSLLNPCKAFMDLWDKIGADFPQTKIQIVPFVDKKQEMFALIESIEERKIDFVVVASDSPLWLERCRFYKLGEYKICCAVSKKHRLANKKILHISDLYGERLIMPQRGNSPVNNRLRDELMKKHPQIHLEDESHFYEFNTFNRCEHGDFVLLTLEHWAQVHPSLVTLPVKWDYRMPYGLFYGFNPPARIKKFLEKLSALRAGLL